MKSGTMVVTGSATVVIPLEACPGPHSVKFVRWWKKKKAKLHCGDQGSSDILNSKLVKNPADGVTWGLEISWDVSSPRKIFWAIAETHSYSF